MRKPVIAGNWKLYKTNREAVDLVTKLIPEVKKNKGVDIVVAPVFTALTSVKQAIAGSNIMLAGPGLLLGRRRGLHRGSFT